MIQVCKIISLDDYRNKNPEKAENPNVVNADELDQLKETIWQVCQSVGLNQFFINLFSEGMPEKEKEDEERG